MTTFVYEGRRSTGERVAGERAAPTVQDAVAALRREQVFVTRIDEARSTGAGRRQPRARRAVRARSLAAFTRQLAVMLDAGLPLLECLELLGGQEADPRLGRAILDTRADVERGASLAEAMRKHPHAFDALYANMVAAGESGGILDTILERLAAYIERAAKLKGQAMAAVMYPAAVIAIAAAMVAVILWKVIPTFAALFTGLGAELPLPTRIVVGASQAFVSGLPWLLAASAVAAVGMRRYYATANGRRVVDGRLLALPLLGPLLRKVAVARFCRTLSTLISSGIPILEGLGITASTCGNAAVEDALLASRRRVERGDTLAAPFRQAAVFPPMMVQMVAVGEATGALDTMLKKVAEFYEDEAEAAVAGLMSLLEPALVAFLGVVVGGIVIAMYLPMFDLIGKLAR